MQQDKHGSATRPAFAPATARFRVIARLRGGSQALISLAETGRQATYLAKRAVAAVIHQRRELTAKAPQSKHPIISIEVEMWVGTLTDGEWTYLKPGRGGYSHRFDSSNRNDRDRRDSKQPKSGDEVDCVLLPQKTRKGGWRAKLAERALIGPITNSADVPKSAKPGQLVRLRIGSISARGNRIQFRWALSSEPVTESPQQA